MKIGKGHVLSRAIAALRVMAAHLERDEPDPLASVQCDLLAAELSDFRRSLRA